QLLLEPQHAGGEEIGERRLDVVELFEVSDEPAALDGEDKAFRGFVMPSGEGIGALERVMGTVDLDRVDLAARIGKLVGMTQPARIKCAAPAAMGPAGDADAHLARATHRRAPRPWGKRRRC